LSQAFTWDNANTAGSTLRLATVDEVNTLFADAGIVGTRGEGLNPAVDSLARAWGSLSLKGGPSAEFWMADPGSNGTHALGHVGQFFGVTTGLPEGWIADTTMFAADVPGSLNSGRAAALIQIATPVPEPSAYALMFAELVLLLSLRKKVLRR
jgi:hypothetical protein